MFRFQTAIYQHCAVLGENKGAIPVKKNGTGIELVSSRVNTELKCIINSSAIKNPCVIIFPALSTSGPTLSRTFCLLRT